MIQPVTGDFSTVLDLFDAVVSNYGDREAIVFGASRLTFLQWAARADALALHLIQEHGVAKGDVVGIRFVDPIDHAVAYQAVLRAGAVVAAFDPRLTPIETAEALQRCQARITLEGQLPILPDGDPLRRHVEIEKTDPVVIAWTENRRAAWFDHVGLKAQSRAAAQVTQVGDRRLDCTSPNASTALTGLWSHLAQLITVIKPSTPWDGAVAAALIEAEHVTSCNLTIAQLREMTNDPRCQTADVSSLRVVTIDAPFASVEELNSSIKRFGCPILVSWTTSEAPLGTSTRPTDAAGRSQSCVGRTVASVEMRVVDELATELTGRGPDFVGEVSLRSRSTMRGYWNDLKATDQAFDDDRWLLTGYHGWIASDGNLHLVGQSAQMYIHGGHDVHPMEIEQCLVGYRKLKQSALVGAPVADRIGEIGVLFAVAVPGATLKIGDLRTFIGKQLGSHKTPDCLVVLDEFPQTSTGTIDRHALTQRAREIAAQWTRPEGANSRR